MTSSASVPDYQSLMRPLLDRLADGVERRVRDVAEEIAATLSLSEAALRRRVPSGTSSVFRNRVGWANTYLKKAGLVSSSQRGYVRITPGGQEVLKSDPLRIDNDFLQRFPSFVQFRQASQASAAGDLPSSSANAKGSGSSQSSDDATPEEALEEAHARLTRALETELLEFVLASSPAFFEQLVVDLLVAMGYGGNRAEAGEAMGKTGDEGVDGVIREDRLGLDVVYVQAKRWSPDNKVSRPEIQKFAGALQGKRARKGVFLTTASFTSEAENYARMIETKIVLIGGSELARLMVEHGVGVSLVNTYDVKQIDTDYFEES